MRRLIRSIMEWAYQLDEYEYFVIADSMAEEEPDLAKQIHTAEEEPVYFCRARPNTVPGFPPEHVHQTPATEADMLRSREFGWMTGEKCIIPAVDFTIFDGSGINHPSAAVSTEGAVHG